MSTTIDDLAARVTALESQRCRCGACREDAKTREQEACYSHAASLKMMAPEDAARALAEVPVRRFVEVVRALGSDVVVPIVLACDDSFADRILGAANDASLGDLVRVERMVRDGSLPRHVIIQPAPRREGPYLMPAASIPIQPVTAGALQAVEAPTRKVGTSSSASWYFSRPAIGHRAMFTLRAWDEIVKVDQQLAQAVADGLLEIRAASLDEDRSIEFQRRADERERASYSRAYNGAVASTSYSNI
jgi:hypothetical protein